MKITIAIIAAVVLAGVVVLQHRKYVRTQNANARLVAVAHEVEQMKSQLGTNPIRWSTELGVEIASLREQTDDLLKLRNEVGQLRKIRTEFEEVQREHNRLLALQPGPNEKPKQGYEQPITLPKDQWLDRGTLTPEATIETFFWAVREWNTNRLVQCIALQHRESFQRELTSGNPEWYLSDVVGINLIARRQLSSASVQIGFQIRPVRERKAFTLTFEQGEWKLVQPQLYVALR